MTSIAARLRLFFRPFTLRIFAMRLSIFDDYKRIKDSHPDSILCFRVGGLLRGVLCRCFDRWPAARLVDHNTQGRPRIGSYGRFSLPCMRSLFAKDHSRRLANRHYRLPIIESTPPMFQPHPPATNRPSQPPRVTPGRGRVLSGPTRAYATPVETVRNGSRNGKKRQLWKRYRNG